MLQLVMSEKKLRPGLYEQVINNDLAKQLKQISEDCQASEEIDDAEAPKILSQYLQTILEKKMQSIQENKGSVADFTNQIISCIHPEDDEETITDPARELLALTDSVQAISKKAKDMERPETSLSQSSLFTGARNEPQLYSEFRKEIPSCTEVILLVSFIKWGGLRMIMDTLRSFTEKGGRLRVLTTSYMGATDAKAVEELNQLPNTEIKVSYDTRRTRMHAKAYLFIRDTGFTTAYVGSSNLSGAAITDGLEWNMKITAQDQPETIQKIKATFEHYWHSNDFVFYDESQAETFRRALDDEKHKGTAANPFIFDIHPYPYQKEILDQLEADRLIRHQYRNLIVAATGTGKTVIAAFDYRRFCEANKGQTHKLLFIAHREEILKQSLNTFRGVLKDPNFGELAVGHYRPASIDHLFASVQTMNSQKLYSKIPVDYYDYIVIDETHHAAAASYYDILTYFRPKILLGMTATPERADGQSILPYFDNHISAEIRLPEAIERGLLSPFQYFGITDTASLADIRWVNGHYDENSLTKLYITGKEAAKRADLILQSVEKYVTDMNEVKGLGFCASIEHARYMADIFNQNDVPSLALTGNSSEEERNTAKTKLTTGQIHFIFVVDIYNEGVDIPEVNTVLFLRPTESLTIFLQQLGRGLRLSENKDCLTVLDFVAQANARYNFENKFQSLMTNTEHSVSYEIKHDFPAVPKGCYIRLEKMAQKYILQNISAGFTKRRALLERIESFETDTGRRLSLAAFADYYHLDLRRIYSNDSWSRLCVQSHVRSDFHEPLEEAFAKAFRHLCQIDSVKWIHFIRNYLHNYRTLNPSLFTEEETLMYRMFYITIFERMPEKQNSPIYQKDMNDLDRSPVMRHECEELLAYRLANIDLIKKDPSLPYACPLEVYASYTRNQLLTGLGYKKPQNIREGVKWLPEIQTDVLLVTLNKADKDYSPTTMYADYSINETLFHWQSQSTTSETSATGQRYIHHKENHSHVLLFIREHKNDPHHTGAEMYTFLGPVKYVSHEGSKPMNIIWKLENPIPAKFLRKTDKLTS